MSPSPLPDRVAWALRALGALDLLATIAVFMPQSWMEFGHAWCGLGTLPDGPLVGYLSRSAAVLYAGHGFLILLIAADTRRNAWLITWMARLALLHGALILGIDLHEGMPIWWTAIEGPGIVAMGALVLALQRLDTAAP